MSADAKLAAAVLKPAVEWVRGQIRKDRENRYSLLRDWTLPATVCSFWPDALAGWQSPLLRVSRLDKGAVSITVKAYQSTPEENICDGATLSPDTIPGILPAAPHRARGKVAAPVPGRYAAASHSEGPA